MPAPIIQVTDLQKHYTAHKKAPGLKAAFKSVLKRDSFTVEAVKGVSFDVDQGELVGFLGPNGAGKTTTLKMLSGILYPTSGQATVLGYTPWERNKAYQRQFSLVMGQKNQLWWDLPAIDSFTLNKTIYDIPAKQFDAVVNQLGKLLNIEDSLNIQVRKLSLGQRMKCELIAALLHQPKVLFLDEPTIGLDVVSQQAIRQFIRQYKQEFQTTILLTSHYMDDVEALCKRIIIIDHGQIIFDGPLQNLKDNYTTKKILTLTFTKTVSPNTLAAFGDVQEYSPQRAVLAVPRANHKQIAAKALSTLPIDDILIGEVDVETIVREVFSATQ